MSTERYLQKVDALHPRCETCNLKPATMFLAAEFKTYIFCPSCYDELLGLIESQAQADRMELET